MAWGYSIMKKLLMAAGVGALLIVAQTAASAAAGAAAWLDAPETAVPAGNTVSPAVAPVAVRTELADRLAAPADVTDASLQDPPLTTEGTPPTAEQIRDGYFSRRPNLDYAAQLARYNSQEECANAMFRDKCLDDMDPPRQTEDYAVQGTNPPLIANVPAALTTAAVVATVATVVGDTAESN